MQRAFELALRPPDHRCLGLALVPLTLGHIIAIEEFGVSVFTSGSKVDASELALCAFICSGDHKETSTLARSRWFRIASWWWGWRCGALDMDEEAKAFMRYADDNLASPSILKQRKTFAGPRPMESPWTVALLASLMGDLGFGYQDALSIPLIRAKALIVALRESRGTLKLADGEDEEWFEFARKVDAGEVAWEN